MTKFQTPTNPHRLPLAILPQPDESTCGPTSLHALYSYFGDDIRLGTVIEEVSMLDSGGTLASLMGVHALRRGYRVTVYTCNLQIFDPTWFATADMTLVPKLRAQMEIKCSPKLRAASQAYIDFLEAGGTLKLEDISVELIRGWLEREIPIITGLSLTWLYRDEREEVVEDGIAIADDIRGEPVGHFVVLSGFDPASNQVYIADPYEANPHAAGQHYSVSLERALCAILLGIVTYDGNLLIIEPKD